MLFEEPLYLIGLKRRLSSAQQDMMRYRKLWLERDSNGSNRYQPMVYTGHHPGRLTNVHRFAILERVVRVSNTLKEALSEARVALIWEVIPTNKGMRMADLLQFPAGEVA